MKPSLSLAMSLPALLGLLLATGPAATAISEQAFEEDFHSHVWPYYQGGRFGTFSGEQGLRIAYATFEVLDERGALVILPGKSESYLKYAELIYDLRESGYSLYLMDHRGMGFSERLLEDDTDKVHVEHFADYIRDVATFIDSVVNARPHARRVILAHSMGGTVALLYMQEHPGDFDAAILCSPMLDILTDDLPEPLAHALSTVATWIGQGHRYCPGHGPWEAGTFRENTMTNSAVRWSLWQERWIPAHPHLESDGPTYSWLRESLAATGRARRGANQVRAPVLMLQAGQDTRVEPAGQNTACSRMQSCTCVRFPHARHEILMERDEIRDRALAEILAFLAGAGKREDP
ncbi:MAG: alpha/beta fold hydrolase [Candidatus Eisenbacteria sp.]|nr:alpha/beta fold hydrolase [Candidatus Eisenbacteria bacterium]